MGNNENERLRDEYKHIEKMEKMKNDFTKEMAQLNRSYGNGRGGESEIPNSDCERGNRRRINEFNRKRFEDINKYNEYPLFEKKYAHGKNIMYMRVENIEQNEKFFNNLMHHLGHSSSTSQLNEQTQFHRNNYQRNFPEDEKQDYPGPSSQYYEHMTHDYPEMKKMEYQ